MLARYGVEYDAEDGVLYPLCDTGFFSNCSFTLAALVHLAHLGIFPRGISFSRGFGNYKDGDSLDDTYPEFFETDDLAIESIRSTLMPYRAVRCPDHHTNYAALPYDEIGPFLQAYFRPSQRIRSLLKDLIAKYEVDPSKTLAVCYRGTDKSVEVQVAEPDAYVRAALSHASSGWRCLIQTDQTQAKDLFLDRIPNAFALDEMPTTRGNVVLHNLRDEELRMPKLQFARNLVATTILLSRCGRVINHCGNMALWIALLRGNAQGMVQFDKHGNRVGTARIFMTHVKNALRRVRQRLRGDLTCYA